MKLSMDTGSLIKRRKCPNCKSKFLAITHFVLKDRAAHAIVFIECHRHEEAEVFFTVTFGTWDTNEATDHVTFSCRYGSVKGQGEMACTIIDTPVSFDSPLAGKRLARSDALVHTRLNEFWEVVDYMVETDKTIHDYLYHPRKSFVNTIFKF